MIGPAINAEIVDAQIIGKDEDDVERARLRDGPVNCSRPPVTARRDKADSANHRERRDVFSGRQPHR